MERIKVPFDETLYREGIEWEGTTQSSSSAAFFPSFSTPWPRWLTHLVASVGGVWISQGKWMLELPRQRWRRMIGFRRCSESPLSRRICRDPSWILIVSTAKLLAVISAGRTYFRPLWLHQKPEPVLTQELKSCFYPANYPPTPTPTLYFPFTWKDLIWFYLIFFFVLVKRTGLSLSRDINKWRVCKVIQISCLFFVFSRFPLTRWQSDFRHRVLEDNQGTRLLF